MHVRFEQTRDRSFQKIMIFWREQIAKMQDASMLRKDRTGTTLAGSVSYVQERAVFGKQAELLQESCLSSQSMMQCCGKQVQCSTAIKKQHLKKCFFSARHSSMTKGSILQKTCSSYTYLYNQGSKEFSASGEEFKVKQHSFQKALPLRDRALFKEKRRIPFKGRNKKCAFTFRSAT